MEKTNSPVQELNEELFRSKDLRLFIKRDDMIHPFVSGNKWRKLKYILEDARKQGKTELVTFGGAYSNHLLATACAGAMHGFTTKGIVRGEEEKELNDTLFLCKLFGMGLIYVSREAYREKDILVSAYTAASSYYIPEGGASSLAVKGCAELTDELDENFTHVFVAAGTATTLSGIARGMAAKYPSCKVEGIASLKASDYLEKQVEKFAPGLSNWKIHHGFTQGYAKADPALLNWVAAFTARTGILLDPVYTGPAMHAIYVLAGQDYFVPKSRILMIHTGGLLGMLGYREYFF